MPGTCPPCRRRFPKRPCTVPRGSGGRARSTSEATPGGRRATPRVCPDLCSVRAIKGHHRTRGAVHCQGTLSLQVERRHGVDNQPGSVERVGFLPARHREAPLLDSRCCSNHSTGFCRTAAGAIGQHPRGCQERLERTRLGYLTVGSHEELPKPTAAASLGSGLRRRTPYRAGSGWAEAQRAQFRCKGATWATAWWGL